MSNSINILGVSLINLILIIHTSFVFSKTTSCYTTILGSYKSCESGNLTIFQEKDSIFNTYPDKIELTNKKVNVLQNKAFENVSSSAPIKTLQLNLAADVELHIETLVFSNFKNLENLEINSASVLLEPDTFYGLDDLKYLKIHIANKTRQHFNDILTKHLNLHKLEFLNHENIDICNLINKNNSLNIIQLQYTSAYITTLTLQSFICLKNLQHFTIAESDLTFIAPGAFNGLEKLKTLSLISNVKLTHIPANVFNIKSLDIIDLSNNSINNIDDGAFKIDNNKLSLLNLSYNSLEIIGEGIFKNIKCNVVDLTHSEIVAVVDGAFNTSQIDTIYFYDNQFFDINILKWGMDFHTTMIYFEHQAFDVAMGPIENNNNNHSSISMKKFTDTCYLSKHNYFEICRTPTLKSLISVRSLVIDLWQPKALHIDDNKISSIDDNTFYNLKITTLIITSTEINFILERNSFAGLTSLKVLKFKTRPILFRTSIFHNLKSLISLEISTTESWAFYTMRSCGLLSNITNLQSLSIVHHNKIDICHEICKSNKFNFIHLRYVSGTFENLQQMVFSCLNKLKYLEISKSSLETVGAGAFIGLEYLIEMTLSSNLIKHIRQHTFAPLKNLKRLILRNNTIKFIDDKSFANKKLLLLDLSYNSLTHIRENTFFGVTCSVLDLSNNNIISIENNAFKNSNLENLYVYNNDKLEKNYRAWAVSDVQIETTCDNKEWIIDICKSHNSISSVKLSTQVTEYFFDILPWRVIDKLEINDNNIQSIDKYAFKNSSIGLQLKTLIITNNNDLYGFNIYPESFEGLTELENLEINAGPVSLKNNLFGFLPSLKYLKIQVDETFIFFSQTLKNLKNLKTVEIVGNFTVSICQNLYSKNISNSIIDIRYTTGSIHSLKANSFDCLPQIEILMITKTQLMTIQAGTFNLLKSLKYLNLSFNKLTRLPMDVFNNLKNLAVLLLNNNEIKDFGDKTSLIFGDKNFNLLNISYNEIKIIKNNIFTGFKCDSLDLSHNKISLIENDAFKNTKIKDLYLFNNTNNIIEAQQAWNIPKSIIVHIKYPPYAAKYCALHTGERIDCDICESHNCYFRATRYG